VRIFIIEELCHFFEAKHQEIFVLADEGGVRGLDSCMLIKMKAKPSHNQKIEEVEIILIN